MEECKHCGYPISKDNIEVNSMCEYCVKMYKKSSEGIKMAVGKYLKKKAAAYQRWQDKREQKAIKRAGRRADVKAQWAEVRTREAQAEAKLGAAHKKIQAAKPKPTGLGMGGGGDMFGDMFGAAPKKKGKRSDSLFNI